MRKLLLGSQRQEPMGKGSVYEFPGVQRGAVYVVVVAMLAMLLTVLIPALPAQADGCGGQSSFGCSDENNNGGSNGTGGGGGQGSNPGTGGGGSGGGGPVDPFLRIDRVVPDPGNCPYRAADGKSALGVDFHWTTIFEYGTKDTPPNNYYYWGQPVYTPGYGYLYSTEVLLTHVCLYPPMTYLTSHTCYVSSTSTVNITQPRSGVIGTKTSTSGYAQGSMDYNACVSSNSRVSMGLSIVEKGFYTAQAYSMAQTATIEVAYTPDGLTGQIPAPKIIGLSGLYQTAPKNATGSLDCIGWSSPGRVIGDWTESACSSQNSTTPSYICSADPVLINGRDFGTNVVQAMKDGKDNTMQFRQSISGSNISVDDYSSKFERSKESAPWDANAPASYNLVEVDVQMPNKTWERNELQANGLTTKTYAGKYDMANLRGFQAGGHQKLLDKNGNVVIKNGEPVWVPENTSISQILRWTGTRTMESAVITGHDTANGVMTTSPTTVTIPTTGTCEQTASIEFLRAIGDSVG